VENIGKHNHWSILEKVGRNSDHRDIYRCRCDCGFEVVRPIYDIIIERSRSCDNCRADSKCGASKGLNNDGHLLWLSWRAMKQRCSPTESNLSKYVGVFGARVTQRWFSYNIFAEEVPPRAGRLLILDRHDYFQDFCPENTIWSLSSVIEEKTHDYLDKIYADPKFVGRYGEIMQRYRHELLVKNWKRIVNGWRVHEPTWTDFEAFKRDVGLPPRLYGQLMKIKRCEPFSAGNVEWATRRQGVRRG
jgi:hypothetical protein